MPVPLILCAAAMTAAAGVLLAGVWGRWCFRRGGPTFVCKLRWPADNRWTAPSAWPRRRVRARWVHDVLIVGRGLFPPRVLVTGATGPDEGIRRSVRGEVGGLGAAPVVLAVRLDDGRVAHIAARYTDLDALAGPYLAATMPALPPAPPQPRQGGC